MEPTRSHAYNQSQPDEPDRSANISPVSVGLTSIRNAYTPLGRGPDYSRLQTYDDDAARWPLGPSQHQSGDRSISDTFHDQQTASRGLGLTSSRDGSLAGGVAVDTEAHQPSMSRTKGSLSRVPVGSRRTSSPPSGALLSPDLRGPGADESARARSGGHARQDSQMSLNEETAFIKDDSESEHSRLVRRQSSFGDSKYRSSWVSFGILFSSVFSTIFSCAFVVIATKAPRYRNFIGTHGTLTPSDAVIITAIVAKFIELTFATACVAFLGQVLSRRAIKNVEGRGVTLAEMTMRTWIMQPGTLVTHWEGVRYAGLTLLGALSLIAAVVTTLYTSAASALVQPQLRFGDWDSMVVAATVKAKYANPIFMASECQTPILGGGVEGTTCLQLQHASRGYHNYERYIAQWASIATSGNGSSDLRDRPQGIALLYENTTVTGPWIEIVPVEKASEEAGGRVVNNVTLALPHAGVVEAAMDKRNGILQPEDLDGLGVYKLHAAVPSPAINVLCVNAEKDELAPLIWETWPDAVNHQINGEFNMTRWTNGRGSTDNTTVIDSLFGWGNSSEGLQAPPVFARFPKQYNTILNHTSNYGIKSIYLLGRGSGENYVLCSLKTFLTPNCSTLYNSASSGSQLEAICTNPPDFMAHVHHTNTSAIDYNRVDLDWPNIAGEAGNSWSLNTGITDGNASNSRLLTQLILQDSASPKLNPALPSPAEALAVLFGGTLLMSSISAPFVTGQWNYTGASPQLGAPYATQYFSAMLRSQEYASGAADARSNGWYLAIFAVFIINVVILAYFIIHRGNLITDFSEPPNLFSLAVNSPPSGQMKGAARAGPKPHHYNVPWTVEKVGNQLMLQPRTPVPDDKPIQNTPRTPLSAGLKGFRNSIWGGRQRSRSPGGELPLDNLGASESGQVGASDKTMHRRSALW